MNEEKNTDIFAGRKYSRALGRRKSATAVAKIYLKGKGVLLINGKEPAAYFGQRDLSELVLSPLSLSGAGKDIDAKIAVQGGGGRGQAQAIRLALSRALAADEKIKNVLRKNGFLTVDARVKERKKPGLKRARRAPQWSKR